MYCKNCGKHISDDSNFCKFCGCMQTSDSITPATNSDSEETTDSHGGSISLSTTVLICSLVLVAFIAIVLIIKYYGQTESQNDNHISDLNDLRTATRSDIVINFKRTSNAFDNDDFYFVLQAQEKIIDLELSIDYKASSGRILKTEKIYIGKVVPGNEYRFDLSLNGMDPSDLDKISKFSWSIVEGKIEE